MAEQEYDMSICDEINGLIQQTDLSNVSANSTGYDELPFGYYRTKFSNVKVGRTRSTQTPMVTLTLEVLEDGYKLNDATLQFERIGGVTKRLIFKNYVIGDSKGLKSLVSDLKKVEDPTDNNVPILTDNDLKDFPSMWEFMKEFIKSEMYIWVHVRETTKKDGTKGSWTDLVSDSTALEAGLPNELLR